VFVTAKDFMDVQTQISGGVDIVEYLPEDDVLGL
jgi:hypothetical protein